MLHQHNAHTAHSPMHTMRFLAACHQLVAVGEPLPCVLHCVRRLVQWPQRHTLCHEARTLQGAVNPQSPLLGEKKGVRAAQCVFLSWTCLFLTMLPLLEQVKGCA